MHPRRETPAAIALLLLLGTLAAAQDSGPGPGSGAGVAAGSAGSSVAPAIVQSFNRRDLAISLLRFERAFAEHPPMGPEIAQANREFDEATLHFFARRMHEVGRGMDALTLRLQGDPADAPHQLAMALRVDLSPAVTLVTETKPLTVTLRLAYDLPGDRPGAGAGAGDQRIKVRILRETDQAVIMEGAGVAPGSADASTNLELPRPAGLEAGAYRVNLTVADRVTVTADRWYIVPRSLDAIRKENTRKLDALQPETPALKQAIDICRSRNNLLSDHRSDRSTAEFLADPIKLPAEVEAEVASLAAGQNPYARRIGDWWRTFTTSGGPTPMRVYAPGAAARDKPLPLVIVLHGAGGDENLFFESYGHGLIKKLADEHELLIASPTTYPLLLDPNGFDEVVAAIQQDYAVNPQRIYVIGHSLGTVVSSAWARIRADKLAAACLIAGWPNLGTQKPAAPVLVMAGGLDPLAKVEQVKEMVNKCQQAGFDIKLQVFEDRGHTLLVPAALPDAVKWLLDHQLPRP